MIETARQTLTTTFAAMVLVAATVTAAAAAGDGFLNFTNAAPDDFEIEGPLTEIDWTQFGDSGGS